MTNATHTPGPWFMDEAADCAHMAQCLQDNPTWIAVEDMADDGGHVAYCAPDNARLIAAAPDLLAVLQEAVNKGYMWDHDTELWSKANAAIAKAKGGIK